MNKNIRERFESNIKKTPSGCWEWQKSLNEFGYGWFCKNGKQTRSHRASWEIYIGDIPKGMMVLHVCVDNPSCVSPAHLYLGDVVDNKKDEIRQKRQAKGENHGMSKLTYGDVLEIKHHIKENILLIKEIATIYGVAPGCISKIKGGNRWNWVNFEENEGQ